MNSNMDRNHDGKIDSKDFLPGQSGVGLNQGVHHNPLDRNHDGKVDARDFSASAGQTTHIQTAERSSIGLVRAEPTKVETIQKNVVVHEHIHPVQKEEIQPVIYREREQLDVKQVTQMMHETQIQPTLVQQRELPAERREAIIEKSAPIAENCVAPSREVDATLRTQVVHAPIVNEVIKKTVVEEIQPVLERDIIQSTVIQNTKPIYEKIVEAPHVHREIVTVQDRGVIGGDIAALEAQGFNLGASGRRLSQGYTSAPIASAPLMNQGLAHHNPLDRNHDGRVDINDLSGRQGLNQGLPLNQGLGMNQGLAQGVHHNPLDRNHDGRVDINDLSGRQGLNQGLPLNQGLGMNQGLAQGVHHNPLDRNHDGRVDINDLSGRQGLNQGLGQPALLTNRGLQSGMLPNQGTHNPLDRNHDGRVNLSDLSAGQGLNNQGLGMNQGLGNQGVHANPLDRNHDGKVDLKDLSGRQNATTANRPVNLL